MSEFSSLGLHPTLLDALARHGYATPTPIQAQSIPHLLDGRDLLGLAQTGTGKTAAFALPLLHRLLKEPRRVSYKAARVLVLSPTRELASQIMVQFRQFAHGTSLKIACVFGGVPMGAQRQALAAGLDVLVATPGRLLDHMGQGTVRLDEVEALVLDEADQMLDMGFIQPLKRIAGALPKRRQTLLFSATLPQSIRQLADGFLHEPVEVAVTPVASTAEKVAQQVIFAEPDLKKRLLVHTLAAKDVDRALVFARTKHGADKLVRILGQAGLAAVALHGNKSQAQRTRALAEFKDGKTPILVATDIAARGIHVDAVSHVVNYELPNVPESYVHRIGRTARAGASGIAISFCAGDERPYLKAIEKLIGQSIPVVASPLGASAPAAAASAPAKAAPAKPAPARSATKPHNAHRGTGHGAGHAAARAATGEAEGDNRAQAPRRRRRRRPAAARAA
ncbi:DEAD/DEAH box helicase [Parapedomonas caeni]